MRMGSAIAFVVVLGSTVAVHAEQLPGPIRSLDYFVGDWACSGVFPSKRKDHRIDNALRQRPARKRAAQTSRRHRTPASTAPSKHGATTTRPSASTQPSWTTSAAHARFQCRKWLETGRIHLVVVGSRRHACATLRLHPDSTSSTIVSTGMSRKARHRLRGRRYPHLQPAVNPMHPSRSIVSLLAGAALSAVCCRAYAAEDVEALIKRQSQEFSDASASGDAAVLARDLDDHVVFMNETGQIATKKDIVDSASPSPQGQSNSLTQTDFKLEMHGSVAVTSFTDVLTQQFHGQTLHAKFLSTEVWLKEGKDWRMISSQTMTQPEDPAGRRAAERVARRIRRNLSGRHRLHHHKIARDGDGLTASVGGGRAGRDQGGAGDVLFTPRSGRPGARFSSAMRMAK